MRVGTCVLTVAFLMVCLSAMSREQKPDHSASEQGGAHLIGSSVGGARLQLRDELADLAAGLGAGRESPLGTEQRVEQGSLQVRKISAAVISLGDCKRKQIWIGACCSSSLQVSLPLSHRM